MRVILIILALLDFVLAAVNIADGTTWGILTGIFCALCGGFVLTVAVTSE